MKAKQRADDDEEIIHTGLETQTALDKEDEWDVELKAYAIPSRIAGNILLMKNMTASITTILFESGLPFLTVLLWL